MDYSALAILVSCLHTSVVWAEFAIEGNRLIVRARTRDQQFPRVILDYPVQFVH